MDVGPCPCPPPWVAVHKCPRCCLFFAPVEIANLVCLFAELVVRELEKERVRPARACVYEANAACIGGGRPLVRLHGRGGMAG